MYYCIIFFNNAESPETANQQATLSKVYQSGILTVNETIELLEIITCGVNSIVSNHQNNYYESKTLSNLLQPFEKLLMYIHPEHIDFTYNDLYHNSIPENSKLEHLFNVKYIWSKKSLLDNEIESFRYTHNISLSYSVPCTPCEFWWIRDCNNQIEKIQNSKCTQTGFC